MEDYLYHYTNIESLALILKNKTIRFNSLDKMDDKQEQMTSDLKRIGQFVYASSWTDEQNESIPMWNMYASLDRGVRIALPKNPFKLYENSQEQVASLFSASISPDSDETNTFSNTYIKLDDMKNYNILSLQSLNSKDDFLVEVEYTDEKDKLYPLILDNHEDSFSISFEKMGKFKNTGWKFQNEWRYLLNIIPFDFSKENILSFFLSFATFGLNLKIDNAIQAVPYWDLSISDEAFKKMQITLSPKLSAGNRLIAESIITKYNPDAQVFESCFKDLL